MTMCSQNDRMPFLWNATTGMSFIHLFFTLYNPLTMLVHPNCPHTLMFCGGKFMHQPFLHIETFHVTKFSNMDRLRWCSADIEHRGFGGCSGADEEALVLQQYGVRLYDGPERTTFEDGVIKLTTHRLLWIPGHNSADSCIALPLAAIINVRFEEGGGIVRSRTPKVVLRLLTTPALENALASLPHQSPWMDRWLTNKGSSYAVVGHSNENHIKLGFTRTGEKEFLRALEETLKLTSSIAVSGCSGADEEALVLQQYGVRLYDGPERTTFEDGVIKLTTHRLLWIPGHNSADSCIALPLAAIINVRFEEGGGIVRSRTPKVVLRLLTTPALENALASLPHQSPWMDRWLTNKGSSYAVVGHSNENHIKLGFTRTGEKEFLRALEETLKVRVVLFWFAVPSYRSLQFSSSEHSRMRFDSVNHICLKSLLNFFH
ncbi:hypothetical protein AHF37_05429 [Paragonimus kellicotti]|nr:hypothetical protein AHF37_05429 [Paragonimus kellicotti]